MSVTARGYQPALKTLEFPKGSTDQFELEFRLPHGKTIRGRAFDRSGKPVPHAWVIIDEWKGFAWASNLEQPYHTDAEGRFAFDAATEEPFKIRISQRGYQDSTMTVSPADGARIWKLERSLEVELRVNDAITGAEVKRFELESGRAGGDGKVDWTAANQRAEVGSRTRRQIHLFGRGSATLPTDVPGWRLRVVAQGYKPLETREIKSDEGEIRLDLGLERLSLGEGGGPSGVVIDTDGKPLSGVEVMLSTTSQPATLNGDSWWYGQGLYVWSGAGTVITDEQGLHIPACQ